jgi:hypothetical protein
MIFLYKELGIPLSSTQTNHKRGVYFCELFENSREYLRQEISEGQLVRKFPNDTDTLVSYWRDNHAKGRIRQLVRNIGKAGKPQPSYSRNSFFLDLAQLTWEQTRQKYLPPDVLAEIKQPINIGKEIYMGRRKGSKNKKKTLKVSPEVDNTLNEKVQILVQTIIDIVADSTRKEMAAKIQSSLSDVKPARKRRKKRRAKNPATAQE